MKVILTREEERKLRRAVSKAKHRVSSAVAVGFIVAMIILAGRVESRYSIEAKITDLDGYTYTAEDVAGYEWKFTDDKLLPVGTTVKLKMYNCLTASRADDEVENVKPMR